MGLTIKPKLNNWYKPQPQGVLRLVGDLASRSKGLVWVSPPLSSWGQNFLFIYFLNLNKTKNKNPGWTENPSLAFFYCISSTEYVCTMVLMWIVWTERNWNSFEDTEKSLVQLQVLCRKTLFDWSRCWGFSNCSSIIEFLSSLSIAS